MFTLKQVVPADENQMCGYRLENLKSGTAQEFIDFILKITECGYITLKVGTERRTLPYQHGFCDTSPLEPKELNASVLEGVATGVQSKMDYVLTCMIE